MGDARALSRSPPAARRSPTASPAGCWGACRATAPRPPTTSAPAARRSTRLEALLARWLPRPLAELSDDVAEILRAATMPAIPRRLLGRRLAPIARALLGSPDAPGEHPRARARRAPARGATPTGSSSGTSTAAGRWPATTRAAGAGPAGRRGSRTPARGSTSPLLVQPRRAAAPLLARRRDPAGRRGRARADRPARPSRRREPLHGRAGRRARQSASSSTTLPVARRSSMSFSASAARSSGKRSPTIGATKPSSARRCSSAAVSRLSSGLPIT